MKTAGVAAACSAVFPSGERTVADSGACRAGATIGAGVAWRKAPVRPGQGSVVRAHAARGIRGQALRSAQLTSDPELAHSPPQPATCAPPGAGAGRRGAVRRCARSWPPACARRADRTVLAVTATDREAEDLGAAAADLLGRDAVAVLPSWETLPHERLSPRPDTVGRRLSIFRRLADPATAPRRGRRRRAQPDPADRPRPGPAGAGEPAGRRHPRLRRPAGAAGRAGLHAGRDGHRARRVRRPRRASSTSSRPPPSTPCASSSGATRSASCARSPSPTSAPSAPSTRCTPRAAGSCCSPTRSASRAAALGPHPREQPAAARAAGAPRRGHPGRGHGVADPGAGRRAELELLTDLLPAGALVLLADPERIRTRSADLVRTGQEFLEASWFAAGMGGGAPIDVGASAYRDLAEVLEHAAGTGRPVRHAEPAGLAAATTRWPRPCTRSSPTAATPTGRWPTCAPTSPPAAPRCSWSAATAPPSARWSSCARPTCRPSWSSG